MPKQSTRLPQVRTDATAKCAIFVVAYQALRGMSFLVGATFVAEVGDIKPGGCTDRREYPFTWILRIGVHGRTDGLEGRRVARKLTVHRSHRRVALPISLAPRQATWRQFATLKHRCLTIGDRTLMFGSTIVRGRSGTGANFGVSSAGDGLAKPPFRKARR